MELFELYLGGHHCNGWSSGIIVTKDSLSRINECDILAKTHLPNYISHEVVYLQKDLEYKDQWNATIIWKDSEQTQWTMELTLYPKKHFF
ncbi:hypothetical protein NVP1121O_082 [Vibrio phage 1.121.O._10N.286.46.C4]|nr:hypothetical protein NVP1121O_082 [Vibrio phage 1.121.O._10N.286.46.C4]